MSEESSRRGEQTRLEIIQGAHDLFVRQGYHGTSMRQIAQQAGIALGGLYNHFESKEDVFRAVFLEYHPYRTVVPMIMSARRETFEQFVTDSFHHIITVLREKPDFMKLMFVEIVEFNSQHVEEMFLTVLPQVLPVIEDVVHINQNELLPIPPLLIMRTFIGSFFAFYLTETMLGPYAPPEFSQNAEDRFIEVLLHGILKPLPHHAENKS
jgi:AcrR family transcriptional regulator